MGVLTNLPILVIPIFFFFSEIVYNCISYRQLSNANDNFPYASEFCPGEGQLIFLHPIWHLLIFHFSILD